MRQIISLFTLSVLSSVTYAQPILTAATSNPIIGDVYYNYYCDLSGVSVGATGASITWNYSGLSVTKTGTTNVVSCSSTLYCDSFSSSSFAEANMPDSIYGYFTADASNLKVIGQHSLLDSSGVGYLYYIRPYNWLNYPVNYGSSWHDTDLYWYHVYGSSHLLEAANNVADGYGTLITPAGTYTNVLRVHRTSYVTDSEFTTPIGIFHSRIEVYFWFQAGFHFPLLTIQTENDPVTDTITGFSLAEFSTGSPITSVPLLANIEESIAVYPNPAKDVIHISSHKEDIQNAKIALFDITGREVLLPADENINSNVNEATIPVSSLSAGIYILRIQSISGTFIKKVAVNK